MTQTEKYAALLEEIGAMIADKNMTIACQSYTIEDLRRKIAEVNDKLEIAEAKIAESLRNLPAKMEGGAA